MSLHKYENRVPPVRGIVLTRNARNKPYRAQDIRRWIRLNRIVYKTEKIDLLIQDNLTAPIGEFLHCANALDTRMSVRVDCAGDPYNFASLKQDGLFDVFLTPAAPDADLDPWLDAARAAALPIRLQLHVPLDADLPVDRVVKSYAAAGVVAVNLALSDPFLKTGRSRDKRESKAHVKMALALANALEAYDIEANLNGLPFCLVTQDQRPRVSNQKQFFLDHQQYVFDSYDLAKTLYEQPTLVARQILPMMLGQHTLFKDPIDQRLFPWILERPWVRARAVAAHRLTRHKRLTRSVPKPLEETAESYEREIERLKSASKKEAGKICGECAMRFICDRGTAEFHRVLPGLKLKSVEGEPFSYPLHFAVQQQKYYDPVDAQRVRQNEWVPAMTERAKAFINDRPADREVDSFDYSIDGQWAHQLPGGVRWYGLTNSEKLSTPLATVDPPFALSANFGGGIAEYIGFSFGRDARIVCPMEAYQHQLTLFVEADGRYVLLRDGEAVRPQQFKGNRHVPQRLGDRLTPRIAITNINHSIVTQNIFLWDQSLRAGHPAPAPKYSVIIVCVRYARRLESTLLNLAHQHHVPPGALEVVVAYVPGLDATDDVIDGVKLACPELRIMRAPFAADRANEKGFMINESIQKAAGEWVMLLDADTLLPPDLFSRIEQSADTSNYLVPDGRKMLTPETTAQILLGNIKPWEEWESLLKDAGEYRHREAEGMPIGFCQCVKRSCLDKVNYVEASHFEGADWQFSVEMREQFGPEKRISGAPVLHLDHGGSKWYGAGRHY